MLTPFVYVTCVCVHVAFLLKMCFKEANKQRGSALLIDSGLLKGKEHARFDLS